MKQHTTPVVVQGNQAIRLQKVLLRENIYNENWIQDLCFNNPTLVPVDEIEPSFGGIIPICKELNTASGPCDLLYLNEQGFITIGECKLWRNPEARRKVVGQILDYAKDIAKWDYQKFQAECLKARKGEETSLFDILKEQIPELEEDEFIDRVQSNLSRGRFLLLIIGDGIRENMEDLVEYLQGHGGLNFSLSLIEIPVFKNPNADQVLLTPRILVKTKEIERTVIRLTEQGAVEEVQPEGRTTPKGQTLSEKDFYERLDKARGHEIAKNLESFIRVLKETSGMLAVVGRGKRLSLNIKSSNDAYNFASIQEDGEVWFYGIATKTDREIGVEYLKSLAPLVNGQFDNTYKPWNWCVKRNGKYIMIDEYLKSSEEWKVLIENTLEKIQQFEDG